MMRLLPSRRQMMQHALLIPIATAATVPLSRATAGFSPIEHLGAPSLRPGLNAYSFLGLLTENAKDPNKGIDLFAVCDFCAKQDLAAVDLTGYFFPGYPKPPDDAFIARIKRHTHNLGLTISGTGVRNDLTTADKSARAEGVQHLKDWIEVAARLGAPTVRAFADSQKPYKNWQQASGNARHEDVEAWMADDLRECAEHGEKFGVFVAVQNHGDFISTGAEHLSLLKRVGHDWCAALVDTGKYLSDDPYEDIAQLVPYAVNWQIKETVRSRTDSPRTDFKKLVKIIRDGGYRGFVPIETLSMGRKDYDPFVEAAKTIALLREAIASAAS